MSNSDEFDFDERMKREMHRVPPPDGFADRVMERITARERRRRLFIMPNRLAAMAVAAMLLVGILLGGWQWRQQEVRKERQQAEVVQRQFDVAMQVTQKTLVQVRMRVGRTVRESVRQ